MMCDDRRPPVDSPEFDEWLKRRASKSTRDILGENHQPADYDEKKGIAGSPDILGKSDAELFPNDLEEHTPEERRKGFKVYKNDDESGIGKDEEE